MNPNNYYVIVPVFNEEKSIRSFITTLKKYTNKIIVVNDGSRDNTEEIIKGVSGISLINLKRNKGKGFAMKLGANYAWKIGANSIIFMDGDNQHNPRLLPKFFEYLDNAEDIIIGIRVVKANIPFIRRQGNRLG